MTVQTTRRSILIGSLATVALSWDGSAREVFESHGTLAGPLDQTSAQQADVLIPAEQLKRMTVEIEAYDETGNRHIGRGYVCSFLDSEQKNYTAIVTHPRVLQDAQRNFQAKRVFLTFTQGSSGGSSSRPGKKTRMEVAGYSARQMQQIDTQTDLAIVATGEWSHDGDTWHLQIA